MKLYQFGEELFIPEHRIHAIRVTDNRCNVQLAGEKLTRNQPRPYVLETMPNTNSHLEAVVVTVFDKQDVLVEYYPILAWKFCYTLDDEWCDTTPLLLRSGVLAGDTALWGIINRQTGRVTKPTANGDDVYDSIDSFTAHVVKKFTPDGQDTHEVVAKETAVGSS